MPSQLISEAACDKVARAALRNPEGIRQQAEALRAIRARGFDPSSEPVRRRYGRLTPVQLLGVLEHRDVPRIHVPGRFESRPHGRRSHGQRRDETPPRRSGDDPDRPLEVIPLAVFRRDVEFWLGGAA